jgi:hypothetical protein
LNPKRSAVCRAFVMTYVKVWASSPSKSRIPRTVWKVGIQQLPLMLNVTWLLMMQLFF